MNINSTSSNNIQNPQVDEDYIDNHKDKNDQSDRPDFIRRDRVYKFLTISPSPNQDHILNLIKEKSKNQPLEENKDKGSQKYIRLITKALKKLNSSNSIVSIGSINSKKVQSISNIKLPLIHDFKQKNMISNTNREMKGSNYKNGMREITEENNEHKEDKEGIGYKEVKEVEEDKEIKEIKYNKDSNESEYEYI